MLGTAHLRLRRLALLACVVAGAGAINPPAAAQTTRTYAVLSLAVDKIDLVTPQMQTGSSIDQNVHKLVTMPDDSMDILVVQAAEAAMKASDPTLAVELYVTRDPKMYALAKENSVVDDAPVVIDTLKTILSDSKATHFLLVTKHRSDARFPLRESRIGMGKVYGVGFYTDESADLSNVNTGEQRQGFVAPFASLKFQLIDLRTRKTVRQSVAMASKVYSGSLMAESAWADMSAQDKALALQRMVRNSVTDGVSKLFAQP